MTDLAERPPLETDEVPEEARRPRRRLDRETTLMLVVPPVLVLLS